MSSMVRAVLSSRVWSSCSLSLANWIDNSVWTFVKSEITSKDTRMSSSNCCLVDKIGDIAGVFDVGVAVTNY